MPKYAFTMEDLKNWETIAKRERPKSPTTAQCRAAPMISSFSTVAMRLGFAITLKLDNGDSLTLRANPAIGQFLLDEIEKSGKICGWLDANHDVTFPLTGE